MYKDNEDHASDGVIRTIMNNKEMEEACISATNISIKSNHQHSTSDKYARSHVE
jgi:hypothetical protein